MLRAWLCLLGLASLAVTPTLLISQKVVVLAFLCSPAEQDDDRIRVLAKVDPVTGAKIDPGFINAGTGALGVREITLLDPNHGRGHLCRRWGIETFEPLRKRAEVVLIRILPDRDHIQW